MYGTSIKENMRVSAAEAAAAAARVFELGQRKKTR
jgi:hypothetical protein